MSRDLSVCLMCNRVHIGTSCAPPRTCYWSLPHRDRHQCDCVCALPKGHNGRHYCQVQLDEFAAALIAKGVTG